MASLIAGLYDRHTFRSLKEWKEFDHKLWQCVRKGSLELIREIPDPLSSAPVRWFRDLASGEVYLYQSPDIERGGGLWLEVRNDELEDWLKQSAHAQ